ncbi:MAG: beta-lactamase family protein [Gammaproteobacteria bacterium]|nr:MAG: beta-lactamase family protein [Gammaproteobacteria bacterium]
MSPLRHAVAWTAALATLTPAAAEPVAELVGRLETARLRGGVPAFAVVLVEREKPAVVRYAGVADLDDRSPVSNRTRFRIGSITKTFTAMAIVLADRAGSLDIEAPLTEATGSGLIMNPWSAEEPVTVARLLEHSAGLQDWVQDEWDLNEPLSLAAALEYRSASRIVQWQPGMFDSYSNNGPGVAARVLELQSGSSYESFVSEHVFQRLGMKTATIIPDAETFQTLATGYDTDGVSVIPYWHVIFRPSAAISLEPADMAPFIRLFLDRGRVRGRQILTADEIRRMETPGTTLAARNGLYSGYGLGLRSWQHRGHLLFGHGGDADGYLSHFGYSRESGRGYFVVINVFRHQPMRDMRRALDDWVTAPLPEAQITGGHIDADTAHTLVGQYRQVTTRFPGSPPGKPIEIEWADGVLRSRIGNTVRELVPVKDRLFRRPWQSMPTAVFAGGPDGLLYLIGNFGNFVKIEESSTSRGAGGPGHPDP